MLYFTPIVLTRIKLVRTKVVNYSIFFVHNLGHLKKIKKHLQL